MKTLVLTFFSIPAYAGGLGVSLNAELMYFELMLIGFIGLLLGGESAIKWTIRKWKMRHLHDAQQEPDQG